MEREIAKRFWSKVDKSGDCWEWTACKNADGYGRIRINGKTYLAHRVVMGMPEGLVLHHCDNPACVNPDHLQIGGQRENMEHRATRGGFHKLDPDRVREARLLRAKGETLAAIGEKMGVHLSTIGKVTTGVNWKHVT